jgi:hypothetical protein
VILLLLLPMTALGEVRSSREDQWLREVTAGIERYARVNGGGLPSTWEEIAAHNPRGIEGATKDFVRTYGFNPLQVYGLLPKPLPLPIRPSHLIIMVRTTELTMSWRNTNGQMESKVYRHVVFRDGEGHILSDVYTAGDWGSLKATIDSLEPLKASEAGFSEQQSIAHATREREAVARARLDAATASGLSSGTADARSEGAHAGRVSYLVAGIVCVLSVVIGAFVTWALCRKNESAA